MTQRFAAYVALSVTAVRIPQGLWTPRRKSALHVMMRFGVVVAMVDQQEYLQQWWTRKSIWRDGDLFARWIYGCRAQRMVPNFCLQRSCCAFLRRAQQPPRSSPGLAPGGAAEDFAEDDCQDFSKWLPACRLLSPSPTRGRFLKVETTL